jgi:hypothetical protein
MEQLDHLIEILVQIVLVEHKYGLGHGQNREGNRRIRKPARVRHGIYAHTYGNAHGGDMKGIAEAENTHLVLCSCEVPHIVRS